MKRKWRWGKAESEQGISKISQQEEGVDRQCFEKEKKGKMSLLGRPAS
jgi:hypothetical protein